MKNSNKKSVEWVFGIHSVQALLKTSSERVQRLYLLQSRKDQRLTKLLALAEKQEVSYEFLSREELDKLIENSAGNDFGDQKYDDQDINHQGAIAQCSPGKVHDESFLNELLDGLEEDPLLLVLDGVTDPHNLGACLRTAEAAGVQAVIAPKDNSASVNPTVRKVASGAAETLPYIVVTNLSRTLKSLQRRGIWIVGSAGEAEQSIYQTDLTGPRAIVMGAEGEGMRRLTREHCDYLASIPMQGQVGSLNVSVAVGVFLFESLRQRGK